MGWALEDHTADVRLRVEAASWAELLCEATRCFGTFVGGGSAGVGDRKAKIEIEGVDAADTWVRYWRAMHRLWTVDALLPLDARLSANSDTRRVQSRITCISADALDASRCEDVKAVTWHAAEAVEVEGRWRGRIVLDV